MMLYFNSKYDFAQVFGKVKMKFSYSIFILHLIFWMNSVTHYLIKLYVFCKKAKKMLDRPFLFS